MAKKLTAKMRQKGMVTRKDLGTAGGGADEGEGGGDSDYEIREDGVQLTEKGVVRKKTGTWATVTAEDDEGSGSTAGGDKGVAAA